MLNNEAQSGEKGKRKIMSPEECNEIMRRHREVLRSTREFLKSPAYTGTSDSVQRLSLDADRVSDANTVIKPCPPVMPTLSAEVNKMSVEAVHTEPAKSKVNKSSYPLLTPADIVMAGRMPTLSVMPGLGRWNNTDKTANAADAAEIKQSVYQPANLACEIVKWPQPPVMPARLPETLAQPPGNLAGAGTELTGNCYRQCALGKGVSDADAYQLKSLPPVNTPATVGQSSDWQLNVISRWSTHVGVSSSWITK